MMTQPYTRPHRQPIRYYGSKYRIAEWIISFFPEHTHYVEPYAGGASVLLSKAPAKIEAYNDLDQSVVIFFKVLRERRDELIEAIKFTPYSRHELDKANYTFQNPRHLHELDDLEIARRFYVRAQQGRSSGSSTWAVSWRYMVTDNRHRTHISEWDDTSHLLATAERLKKVQFDCRPALEVIESYDTPQTLFYLDPPYLHDTRQSWLKAYRFEMSEADHRELAERLQAIEGMAIISGYPSDLYAELYEAQGWRIETITARCNNNDRKVEATGLIQQCSKGKSK